MELLVAFDAAGALEMGNDHDTDGIVAALKRLGAQVVDPVAQMALRNGARSNGSGDAHFADGGGGGARAGSGGGGSVMRSSASERAAGHARGREPASHPMAFTRLFEIILKTLRHPADRVVAAALQIATDAVSHLSWEGASGGGDGGGGGGGGSDIEAVHVTSILCAALDCLVRESLRRATRLLFSAAVAKVGPAHAVGALIRVGSGTDKVCVCVYSSLRCVHARCMRCASLRSACDGSD
jgi:hypothetical protein